jgi:hypothetical protein
VSEGLNVPLKDFWEAYKDWSSDNNIRIVLKRRELVSRLQDNFPLVQGTPLSLQGLSLKADEEWEYWDPDELRQIYLISNGLHIKIGISIDPRTRMEFLQVGSSLPLELIDSWSGSWEEEKQWHREFSSKRVRGEWFDLSPEDLKKIEVFRGCDA